MRGGLRGVSTLAGLLFALSAAGVPSFEVAITAGFAGVVPAQGRLVPVTVMLNNQERDTIGLVEIFKASGVGSQEVVELYEVKSPLNSTHRHTWLTRVACDQRLRVRVSFSSTKLRPESKESFTQVADKRVVLGIGIPNDYWQAQPARLLERYQLAAVTIAELPDQALALDSVHAVLISGLRLADLSAAQVAALSQWVAWGGVVIVVGTVAEPAFAAHLGQLHPRLGAGSGNGAWGRGAGWVAVDDGGPQARRPFWAAPEQSSALFHLFPDTGKVRQDRATCSGHDETGLLGSMTRARGSYGLSGFLWLTLIIGAYILVIGPLDWWVVKRTGRPWFTWVVFLGAIVCFSLVSYGYSNLVHSGTMQTVSASVLDVAAGDAQARGNAIFWVYSTRNSRYHLSTPREHVVFSARESGLGAGQVAGVTVKNGKLSEVIARIPIFSAKTFDATWTQPLAGAVQPQPAAPGQTERFVLPEKLPADGVWLASPAGLRELVKVADTPNTWTESSGATAWDAVPPLYRGLIGEGNYYGPFGPQGHNTFPDRGKLTSYLLWLSVGQRQAKNVPLPAPGEKAAFEDDHNNGNVDWQTERLYSGRDSREHALNVFDTVRAGGRVLLVMLAPSMDPVPLEMNVLAPQRERVALLRVHFAP